MMATLAAPDAYRIDNLVLRVGALGADAIEDAYGRCRPHWSPRDAIRLKVTASET